MLRQVFFSVFPGVFFPLVFRSSFGWSFAALGLHLGALGQPLGRLFVTFLRFVGFCWMALTLKRKPLFSGFGALGSALFRHFFQVWIQGVFLCVFMWFSVISGALWSSFGVPWAAHLGQIRHLVSGWVPRSSPALPKGHFGSPFWYYFRGFRCNLGTHA